MLEDLGRIARQSVRRAIDRVPGHMQRTEEGRIRVAAQADASGRDDCGLPGRHVVRVDHDSAVRTAAAIHRAGDLVDKALDLIGLDAFGDRMGAIDNNRAASRDVYL